MNRILLFLFFLMLSTPMLAASTLSEESKISLLTCGAGDDLYSVFGHSALRVTDEQQGIDIVFNYGTFDFDAPNFYLNFARGKLNYILSVSGINGFMRGYVYEERYVLEQDLDLTLSQRQALFEALKENRLPENRAYLYDFFYDNCSTRIRDMLKKVLGESLDYRFDLAPENDMSFRDYIEAYTFNVPWGDFGIDLALGLPTDKKVTPFHRMFLPEEMKLAFDRAVLLDEQGNARPLVAEERMLLDLPVRTPQWQWGTPVQLFWLLALMFVFLWWKNKLSNVLTRITQGVFGLVGLVMVLLWFATDHTATAWNFNLLWAMPTWLLLAVIPSHKKAAHTLSRVHRVLLLATLLGWFFWPQDLHPAVVAIVVMLGVTVLRMKNEE
ncbi:MAG: DUF4105 domain-containing protein [Cryomorphaceae bacterium]|nr:DUF4105 domain-containing protein [Cryomorphaceae bacterium]